MYGLLWTWGPVRPYSSLLLNQSYPCALSRNNGGRIQCWQDQHFYMSHIVEIIKLLFLQCVGFLGHTDYCKLSSLKQVYSLTVQEARSLTSRLWQGHTPSSACRSIFFWSLLASDGPCLSLACFSIISVCAFFCTGDSANCTYACLSILHKDTSLWVLAPP